MYSSLEVGKTESNEQTESASVVWMSNVVLQVRPKFVSLMKESDLGVEEFKANFKMVIDGNF